MNKQRRKKLGEAFDKLCEVSEILAEVKDEEQEAYDNLPENFQYGERGEEMQNYIRFGKVEIMHDKASVSAAEETVNDRIVVLYVKKRKLRLEVVE